MAEGKVAERKSIEATQNMHRIMADYFYELNEGAQSPTQKIAWCTSVGPAEILRAMGFLVYFPENHGALLGATRMATDLIPEANALGYSPDICSYLKSDIGAFVKGVTPLSKAYKGIESVPKPDVLVYNTNQCRDVKDWFSWYSREYKVPVVGVETHRGVGSVTDAHVESVARQLEALVPKLEEITGERLDMDEMRRVLGLSRRCSDLWKEVLDTASNVPAPLTFYDGTIHMGPAVVLRGTQEAVDYYELLLAEMKERVKNHVAAVEGERFRLYWDGMPVWGRLSTHSKMFASLQTNVLASTYCNSWIFTDFDPDDPFRSMAKAYTELFIVRADEVKEEYIRNMMKFFQVDGIIYHDSKTCPNNSNTRYGMPQRMEKITGLPYLTIDGDLNDMRLISDEQVKTNVEAFVEQLEERR